MVLQSLSKLICLQRLMVCKFVSCTDLKSNFNYTIKMKQGRMHGKTVADGWAGAVMQKLLEIQKYLLRTDVPTYRPTR